MVIKNTARVLPINLSTMHDLYDFDDKFLPNNIIDNPVIPDAI